MIATVTRWNRQSVTSYHPPLPAPNFFQATRTMSCKCHYSTHMGKEWRDQKHYKITVSYACPRCNKSIRGQGMNLVIRV